jgi:hypothetical protein
MNYFYALCTYDQGITVKALLHYILYMKTIIIFQSNDKHKFYLEKAKSL